MSDHIISHKRDYHQTEQFVYDDAFDELCRQFGEEETHAEEWYCTCGLSFEDRSGAKNHAEEVYDESNPTEIDDGMEELRGVGDSMNHLSARELAEEMTVTVNGEETEDDTFEIQDDGIQSFQFELENDMMLDVTVDRGEWCSNYVLATAAQEVFGNINSPSVGDTISETVELNANEFQVTGEVVEQ